MKKLFLAATLCFFMTSFKAVAQSFPVPDNYSLLEKEDFIKYEPDVIRTADWLQQTPWTEQADNQDKATKFLTDWAEGVPYVTINVSQKLLRLCKRNTKLLFIYIGQFCKYAVKNKTGFNKTQADIFAVRSMLIKYTHEPSHRTDANLEKVIEIYNAGKLDEWVKNDFEKP